jgi:hypothetical protein
MLDRFSKNPPISKCMNIRRVGPELAHAGGRVGGRTDGQPDRHDEAYSRASQFCERA